MNNNNILEVLLSTAESVNRFQNLFKSIMQKHEDSIKKLSDTVQAMQIKLINDQANEIKTNNRIIANYSLQGQCSVDDNQNENENENDGDLQIINKTDYKSKANSRLVSSQQQQLSISPKRDIAKDVKIALIKINQNNTDLQCLLNNERSTVFNEDYKQFGDSLRKSIKIENDPNHVPLINTLQQQQSGSHFQEIEQPPQKSNGGEGQGEGEQLQQPAMTNESKIYNIIASPQQQSPPPPSQQFY